MAVIGVSSITPAFPKIMKDLNISEGEVSLLVTVFAVPGIILAPLLGTFADRIGRKRTLLPSLVLFGLAGGACGFTQDLNVLVVLRLLQGIGGSALGAISWTILSDIYSGHKRVRAMGLNASVLSVGNASYPLIGGALAALSWSYPFMLPLVSLPLALFAMRYLDSPEPREQQNLVDYIRHTGSYLKNIRILSVFMASIVIFIIIYGAYLTYFSLHLGITFNAPPQIIGLILSGSSVTSAIVSAQLGKIVKFISLPNLVKLGFGLHAVSMFIIPFMPSLGFFTISIALFGIGSGITFPCLQSILAESAPSQYRAAVMSINATMFRIGQALGPPIFTLAFTYANFDGVFYTAAGISLAASLAGVIGSKLIRTSSDIS